MFVATTSTLPFEFIIEYKDAEKTGNSSEMYDYGSSSLITDRTRVYKGGSWKDRAYWLNPCNCLMFLFFVNLCL